MTTVVLVFAGIIGAISTYWVAHSLKQGVVRASALLSLIVGLFFYFFPEVVGAELTLKIPLVFCGATFVGMTGKNIEARYWVIALAGGLFSGLFMASATLFNGFGGGLGTTACVSIIALVSFVRKQKGDKTIEKI